MGAWGIKTFENDDALDWLADLEKTLDLSLLVSTLAAAESDYIEAPEGTAVLAAAEVIIGLSGSSRPGLPENVIAWIQQNSSLNADSLRSKAHQVVTVILSDTSELKALWQETEDFDSWKTDVESIRDMLLQG